MGDHAEVYTHAFSMGLAPSTPAVVGRLLVRPAEPLPGQALPQRAHGHLLVVVRRVRVPYACFAILATPVARQLLPSRRRARAA